MKKIIIIAAMLLGFAVAASAQPRAIGLRGGIGVANISYQHSMGFDFVEAGVGLWGSGFSVEGIYNVMLAQPSWTNKGEWGVYAGGGARVGVGNVFSLGVGGQVGLEYTFWFPLQLSLDIRPMINVTNLKTNPVDGFYPTLGIRYKF